MTRAAERDVLLSKRRRLGSASDRDAWSQGEWVFSVARADEGGDAAVEPYTLMTPRMSLARGAQLTCFGVDVPRALELCAAAERALKGALDAVGLPRELAELAARCAWPALSSAHAATARALAV